MTHEQLLAMLLEPHRSYNQHVARALGGDISAAVYHQILLDHYDERRKGLQPMPTADAIYTTTAMLPSEQSRCRQLLQALGIITIQPNLLGEQEIQLDFGPLVKLLDEESRP